MTKKPPSWKKSKKTLPGHFAAIDFETADYGRDSACSLSVVLADVDGIKEQKTFMIKPPRKEFVFTYLHGISWSDVSGMPDFKGHWPDVRALLNDVSFIAAHNATFDRSVMNACCGNYGLKGNFAPYLCTVKLARSVWGVFPTKLPDVCRHLKVPLKHHNACSDALACAKIVCAAIKEKVALDKFYSK